MLFARSSGILLHPTSLPTGFGVGDLGPAAYRFIDFLERTGQSYWQILPMGPTGYGDSPYQSFSAFAGSKRLVSPELLAREGLLERNHLAHSSINSGGWVDLAAADRVKTPLLNECASAFLERGVATPKYSNQAFNQFKQMHHEWLDAFTLFMALKERNGGRAWFEWPDEDRVWHPGRSHDAEIEAEMERQSFFQFVFFTQWQDLKNYAASKGVRIIGDLPLFVALDSADVWSAREDFKLHSDGTPQFVAGVPPDHFSETGQLWGNPIYDWMRMREGGFAWWVRRMRHSLAMFDVVRIDHFRGFAANYEIPGGSETAAVGEWVEVPGNDLFSTLAWVFGDLPVIAEDLGFITDDVNRLRDRFGLPGMRILQYAFGGDPGNPHRPHNYPAHCVAYTGTHDNETFVGWFESLTRRASVDGQAAVELGVVLEYLGGEESDVHWSAIRSLMASPAALVVIPMQDVLGLGDESRMNVPGTVGGNWSWAMSDGAVTETVESRLGSMTEVFGRAGRGFGSRAV